MTRSPVDVNYLSFSSQVFISLIIYLPTIRHTHYVDLDTILLCTNTIRFKVQRHRVTQVTFIFRSLVIYSGFISHRLHSFPCLDNADGNSRKWSKYLANNNNLDDDDDDDNEETKRIIKSNMLKLTSQEVIDEDDSGLGNKMTFAKSATTSKSKITETLRDSCLPKMLCEMAARPNQLLNDREKDLLSLIK